MSSKNESILEKNKTLVLPLDKLPEHWLDNDRLNVLYSPVRNKQVNSRDGESKFDFWKQSIQVYCTHNKLYHFTVHQLQRGFVYNGRTPSCLKPIILELIKSGEIQPINEFVQKRESTWSGWITNALVKKPLSWSFNKVKNSIVTADITNVEYVHVAALQHDADELFNNTLENFTNKVVELKVFAKSIGHENIGNLKMMLQYLENNGKVALREDKLSETESLILIRVHKSDGTVKPITDVDRHIYKLAALEGEYSKKIAELESAMENLRQTTKQHMKVGHKQLAKTVLYKKHILDKRIEKMAHKLFNITSMSQKFEEAKDDQELFAIYKSASENFRSVFKELNEDMVADTMADLGEAMDIHADIQSSLGQNINPSESDSDLEAELAELLAEDDDNTNSANNTSPKPNADVDEVIKKVEEIKLPDVPSPEPNVTPNEKETQSKLPDNVE